MEDTYTYIARSADSPLKVATFTLNGDSLAIGMGPPTEQLASVIDEDSQERPWVKPLAMTAISDGAERIALADVRAVRMQDDLDVQIWVRAGGLRLAPVRLHWDAVDNPAAADDFVRELKERKQAARDPSRFPGFLDYWVSWIVGGLTALALGIRWLRRK